jgi:hypothetical protein
MRASCCICSSNTNVYLRFFGFSADELEELRKAKTAIASGELKLWVTQQTRDELLRNREAEVARSIDALSKLRPTAGAPLIARQLPEFDDFMKARREFEGQINLLVDLWTERVTEHKLAADQVLAELLEAAGILACPLCPLRRGADDRSRRRRSSMSRCPRSTRT